MIVVSHRGPASFVANPDGAFSVHRGAGGVVSGLIPLLLGNVPKSPTPAIAANANGRAKWIAAAVSDDDRAAVAAGTAQLDEVDLHLLAFDPALHRLHYDLISNAILWFLHHGLFDLPRRPLIDRRFSEAWDGYIAVNQRFADEVTSIATDDEIVLVQDYHLALVPGMVHDVRPELRVTHFTHTPFCGPDSIRVLPDDVGRALISSMAKVPCGFHTSRWARSFEASAHSLLDFGTTTLTRPIKTFVAPLGPDIPALQAAAARPETQQAATALEAIVGDRAVILRVDRMEPSKNILRGFRAYELFLQEHPRWRERVVFVACLPPSREGLAEYLAYRAEAEQAVIRLNEQWGTTDWQPVVLDTRDDYLRSIAALGRYDALLVNPIRDGLNLVAKEGPVLNARGGVLCLSREAGAFDELGEAALVINPFDVADTAQAIHDALEMPAAERTARARKLHELSAARTPSDWLADLLSHAGDSHP